MSDEKDGNGESEEAPILSILVQQFKGKPPTIQVQADSPTEALGILAWASFRVSMDAHMREVADAARARAGGIHLVNPKGLKLQ